VTEQGHTGGCWATAAGLAGGGTAGGIRHTAGGLAHRVAEQGHARGGLAADGHTEVLLAGGGGAARGLTARLLAG
jgi:hypothetical protein